MESQLVVLRLLLWFPLPLPLSPFPIKPHRRISGLSPSPRARGGKDQRPLPPQGLTELLVVVSSR